MAIRLKDVVEDMKQVLRSPSGSQARSGGREVLSLAADFLVRALAKDPEHGQVAILMIVPEHGYLAFAYPDYLAQGNVLPIGHDSFAGRVVLRKQILIENNVPQEPHKDFFERIPGPSGKARAIQKMVAAPIFGRDGEVLGVVEVSRTGEDRDIAGDDFSPKDGENLARCCQVFAPFIARTWVREFA